MKNNPTFAFLSAVIRCFRLDPVPVREAASLPGFQKFASGEMADALFQVIQPEARW